MTQTFAAAAGRLAGLVCRHFGWRPGEFWEATPAELAAILEPAGDLAPAPLGRADLTRLMEQDK